MTGPVTGPVSGGGRGGAQPVARWRRRAWVVLLGLACGALLLAVAGPAWVLVDLPAGPGGSAPPLEVAGSTAAAAVPALGLVAVAGAVALSTLNGAGRAVAAALLLAAGLGAAAAALSLAADPSGAAAVAARAATGVGEVDGSRVTAWPLVAILPAAGVVLSGALALASGRAWSSSARFEAPTTARPAARRRPAQTPAGLWDDLSQGVDPTAGAAGGAGEGARGASRDGTGAPRGVPADAESPGPAE